MEKRILPKELKLLHLKLNPNPNSDQYIKNYFGHPQDFTTKKKVPTLSTFRISIRIRIPNFLLHTDFESLGWNDSVFFFT